MAQARELDVLTRKMLERRTFLRFRTVQLGFSSLRPPFKRNLEELEIPG